MKPKASPLEEDRVSRSTKRSFLFFLASLTLVWEEISFLSFCNTGSYQFSGLFCVVDSLFRRVRSMSLAEVGAVAIHNLFWIDFSQMCAARWFGTYEDDSASRIDETSSLSFVQVFHLIPRDRVLPQQP